MVASVETLDNFCQMPLKAKTAYHVARLVREVERENGLFQEKRNALIQKYCKKDEKGEPIVNEEQMMSVAPENMKVFLDEINELLDSEISLNVEKIKIDDITCEVSPQMMNRLMVFIED